MNEIKKIIGTLTPKWFNDVYNEFKNHVYYQLDRNILYDELEIESLYFDSENFEEISYTQRHEFKTTFMEYAWSGLLLHFQDHKQCDSGTIKGLALSREIINVLTRLLNISSPVNDKYKIISFAVQTVINDVNQLKASHSNIEYGQVLDYIVNQIRYELGREFSDIKQTVVATESFEEKLEFDLSKRELAFLLTWMTKADLFAPSCSNSIQFNNFCSKYFYFYNQKQHSYTRATNINKEISEVRSLKTSHEFNDIKERLKIKLLEALKEM